MPVYKDKKSGKWYYEFSYKTIAGETRRRKKRGFALKKDAQDAEAAERMKLKDAPPSSLTFGQLYKLYLKASTPEWLPGTERKVREHIEQHILPMFKDIRIDNITTKDIEDWKIQMYNKTYSTSKGTFKYKISTLNNFRRDFSAVFNYAINHRYIAFNPVRAVQSFKDPKALTEQIDIEKQVWSSAEFHKFISAVDDEMWNVFFTFLWVTGVRIGEAQGVMFKDVDFENSTLTIRRSIDTKQKGIPYVINPTKTKMIRMLELPSKFMDILKPYCEQQKKLDDWTPDKFLFGFDKPLANSTIDKKRGAYIAASGVKYISSHCFRHSHATYLLSNGIDIKSVSERLGHKDVHETLNTYVHVLPMNKSKILNLVNETL